MLQVLNDNILIRRSETKDKEGSIYIPDVAKEQPAEGTVVNVGSSVSGNFKPGDLLVFGKYAGVEIVEGAEILVIIREKDVLGIRD